jgi:hypothetical protein
MSQPLRMLCTGVPGVTGVTGGALPGWHKLSAATHALYRRARCDRCDRCDRWRSPHSLAPSHLLFLSAAWQLLGSCFTGSCCRTNREAANEPKMPGAFHQPERERETDRIMAS